MESVCALIDALEIDNEKERKNIFDFSKNKKCILFQWVVLDFGVGNLTVVFFAELFPFHTFIIPWV